MPVLQKVYLENPLISTHPILFGWCIFVYKYNPFDVATELKSQVRKKTGEGLKKNGKRKQKLAGGRRSHLTVAVADG